MECKSHNNNSLDNNISNDNIQQQNPTAETQYNNTPNIRAPKRMREQIPNFLFEYSVRTPRLSTNDSPFKLLNLIDKRFENMMEFITKFEESESRMKKMLDERFNELKSDIENSVVATDLRINGIPFNKNENLLKLFESLCHLLNINSPAVKSIYRLQNNNNKINTYSSDAVIMFKLFSSYDKNFTLKTLAKFRNDRPFYVNENLTLSNHKFLQLALRLKNTGKLFLFFTKRGLVYDKLNKDIKPVRVEFIYELDDLDYLFRADNPNVLI
ncbi:hypothetical protein CVS40_3335 [Lucilia cuprina]|nr:hypothetical protein CVS40_3335 [Lucilia cuprina]